MKWNHLTKILVAIGLAVLMFVSDPVRIFAAGQKQYLSEVKIGYGKKAKENLKEAGYTVLEKNIGDSLEDGVFLGYKTTKDPNEAITDLSMMNMNGGYSFDDYDNLLKEQVDAIGQVIDGLIPAIEEYQANYAAGTVKAVYAYEQLNMMIEDDSTLGMGDYLLKEIDRDNLTQVILQTPLIVINTIKLDLAMACSDSWVERFLSADEDADYDAGLDEAVDVLFNSLETLQTCFRRYELLNVPEECTDEEAEYFFDNLTEQQLQTYMDNGPSYDYMASIPYGDGTLLDFFMQDLDEMDPSELYPMAAAMTKGQLASLDGAGLIRVFMYSVLDEDSLKTAEDAMVEVTEKQEPVSIYTGVDRSLFTEGGVALTDEAARKMSASGDLSWYSGNIPEAAEKALAYLAQSAVAVTGLSLLVLAGAYIAKDIIQYGVEAGWSFLVSSNKAAVFFNTVVYADSFMSEWAVSAIAVCGKIISVATTIAFCAFAAAVLFVATLLIWEAAAYGTRHIDYTEIPRVMVDDKLTKSGEHDYTIYYAVTDLDGKYADLNKWRGEQWNALYYTKDPKAGDPIIADFLFHDDGYTPNSEYQGVIHAFGSDGAYNLRAHSKVNITESGLYFFISYKTDPNALSLTATSVNTGRYALFSAGGAVIGILGTVLVEKLLKKKKATA